MLACRRNGHVDIAYGPWLRIRSRAKVEQREKERFGYRFQRMEEVAFGCGRRNGWNWLAGSRRGKTDAASGPVSRTRRACNRYGSVPNPRTNSRVMSYTGVIPFGKTRVETRGGCQWRQNTFRIHSWSASEFAILRSWSSRRIPLHPIGGSANDFPSYISVHPAVQGIG